MIEIKKVEIIINNVASDLLKIVFPPPKVLVVFWLGRNELMIFFVILIIRPLIVQCPNIRRQALYTSGSPELTSYLRHNWGYILWKFDFGKGASFFSVGFRWSRGRNGAGVGSSRLLGRQRMLIGLCSVPDFPALRCWQNLAFMTLGNMHLEVSLLSEESPAAVEGADVWHVDVGAVDSDDVAK